MSALQLIEVKSPVEWVMRNKTDSGQPYEITFLLNKDTRKVKLSSPSTGESLELPKEFPEVVSELSFLKNVCYFSLMYFVYGKGARRLTQEESLQVLFSSDYQVFVPEHLGRYFRYPVKKRGWVPTPRPADSNSCPRW